MPDLTQDDRAKLRGIVKSMRALSGLISKITYWEWAIQIEAIAGPPPLEKGWYWTAIGRLYWDGAVWFHDATKGAQRPVKSRNMSNAPIIIGPRIGEPE